MELSDVLAALPGLSPRELEVVIAAASALSQGDGSKATKRPGKQAKPARAKAKPSKPKGPAQQESKYSAIPEYREFKVCDRALRVYLKTEGKALSDFLPKYSGDDDKVDEAGLPAPVLAYKAARDCWFRTKAKLSSDEVQAKPVQGQAPDPEKPGPEVKKDR